MPLKQFQYLFFNELRNSWLCQGAQRSTPPNFAISDARSTFLNFETHQPSQCLESNFCGFLSALSAYFLIIGFDISPPETFTIPFVHLPFVVSVSLNPIISTPNNLRPIKRSTQIKDRERSFSFRTELIWERRDDRSITRFSSRFLGCFSRKGKQIMRFF